MKDVILVFLGGGLGSVARYGLGIWLNDTVKAIPLGTILANVLGSLLIGFLLTYAGLKHWVSPQYTLLLATGFCGGFTTFSTFAYENHLYIKNNDYLSYLPYTFGSLLLGFLAVFLGVFLANKFV